ncbi:MAG: sulfotransferase [bacterium]
MTDKKIVERAKSVFHTALYMLRDEGVIDQTAVKRISNELEEEIKLTKNREDFLFQSLPNWLSTTCREIVIVDWSSDNINLVDEISRRYPKPEKRIVVIRVDNEKYYDMARSRNLAMYMCQNPIILSTDSDVMFDKDIFEKLDYDFLENGFYRGYRDADILGTTGTFMVKSEKFWSIGGYNESYSFGYQCIDINLYKRFQLDGKLNINFFPPNLLRHIDHSDELRIEHREIPSFIEDPVNQRELIQRMQVRKYDSTWNIHSLKSPFNFYVKTLEPEPIKYFGIGLSKTGQITLIRIFKTLGFSVSKYPHTIERVENKDFSTGITVTAWFIEGELQKQFPNAKYIYTYLDPDEWIKVAEEFWSNSKINTRRTPELTQLSNWCHNVCYGSPNFDKDLYYQAYKKHDNFVRNYFKNRQEDLLIVDLNEEDGWERVCKFTNSPIIKNPAKK